MTRCVIWRCPSDGRQHLATLTSHPARSDHVQTLCGKTIDEIHPCDLLPLGEITCEQCRTEETLVALAKHSAA